MKQYNLPILIQIKIFAIYIPKIKKELPFCSFGIIKSQFQIIYTI
jgi:hypothetical protein